MPYSVAAVRGKNFGNAVAFTPNKVTGLLLWLDFSDATTLFTDAGTTPVASDGDLIYQANDKSGNAKHALVATSTNRPAYKVNIKNSLSAGRFDGVDNFLRSAAAPTQPYTIYLVGSLLSYASNDQLIGGVTANSGVLYESGTPNVSLYAGSAGPSISWASGFKIATALFSGASSSIRANAAAASTGDAGTTNPGGVTIASSNSAPGGTAFANIDLCELLVYSGAIASGNDALILAYLNNKWAVY